MNNSDENTNAKESVSHKSKVDVASKKNEKPTINTVLIGVGIAVLIIGGLFIYNGLVGISGTANAQAQALQTRYQNPAFKTTASAMTRDYTNNEIAADNKYKGKIVEISGYVGEIGKDILNTPYLTLIGENPYVDRVQCMFDNENELLSLNQQDEVTVVGVVEGKSILNIIVRHCHVKK